MDIMTIVMLIVGLVLLVMGAELLVRGATRIAAMAGIPPLIVGLTVVSFGTSAPELAVSAQAALSGQADISLGNVIGSNLFNVLAILGISALVAPLIVSRQLVRLDVPVMIGVSGLLLLLALDGDISRVDGLILLLGAVGYTGFLVILARNEGQAAPPNTGEVVDEFAKAYGRFSKDGWLAWAVNLLLVAVGLVLLVVGSDWLVEGAVAIAAALGISQLVIGLTVVAAGTSLPELATSIIASLRGERDIAVGNVVGSNIYNILLILGTAAVLGNGMAVPQGVIHFDLPVMVAVAVACLPIFFTNYVISRWNGAVFLGYFVAYLVYVVLAAIQHEAMAAFGTIMLVFVMPLTVLTLGIVLWRFLRRSELRGT